MTISIVRPHGTLEIITDFTLLQETINLYNQLIDLDQDDENEFATETENANRRKEQDRIGKRLKALAFETDAKTLVFELTALNSSAWNQITLKHAKTDKDGRTIRDWPALIAEALPLMISGIHWKTGDAPVEMQTGELIGLIGEFTDSQTADALRVIQEINTPISTLPKAISQRISNTSRN
ncbi:hypothetical protein AB4915_05710 [Bifidobacterium dentium]|uniref:hypothetical protein n=1 Tax=Bifidobacterium dentium TaxID=1689 RepID=UPI003D16D11F